MKLGEKKGKERKRKEEGKIEAARKKAISIAKNLLLKDYTIDDIVEVTGLSGSDIEQIS